VARDLTFMSARRPEFAPEYAVLPTPLGDALIVRHADAIVRMAFADEDRDDVLDRVGRALGSPAHAPSALATAARELDEYFEGRRRSFTTRVDLGLAAGFRRRVLEAARNIPFGAVATYGHLAALAGCPRGGRAAGNALRGNPVPILVPCHRVVPADGSIGGYGGQEWRKAFLLDLEAA
jgi:methylated-DNA-[protein]-cysteine S-methyltransferase